MPLPNEIVRYKLSKASWDGNYFVICRSAEGDVKIHIRSYIQNTPLWGVTMPLQRWINLAHKLKSLVKLMLCQPSEYLDNGKSEVSGNLVMRVKRPRGDLELRYSQPHPDSAKPHESHIQLSSHEFLKLHDRCIKLVQQTIPEASQVKACWLQHKHCADTCLECSPELAPFLNAVLAPLLKCSPSSPTSCAPHPSLLDHQSSVS